MNNILFEDIFEIEKLNECGKKFERVNRLHCKGTTHEVDLIIDVNAELFDVRSGERTAVALASTISLDGSLDDGLYNPGLGPSLMDSYDYVMHGRIFAIKHIENHRIELQASFGGLLMKLKGQQALVNAFTMDTMIFILMRKGGIQSYAMDF
eukprot:gene17955-23584_t